MTILVFGTAPTHARLLTDGRTVPIEPDPRKSVEDWLKDMRYEMVRCKSGMIHDPGGFIQRWRDAEKTVECIQYVLEHARSFQYEIGENAVVLVDIPDELVEGFNQEFGERDERSDPKWPEWRY